MSKDQQQHTNEQQSQRPIRQKTRRGTKWTDENRPRHIDALRNPTVLEKLRQSARRQWRNLLPNEQKESIARLRQAREEKYPGGKGIPTESARRATTEKAERQRRQLELALDQMRNQGTDTQSTAKKKLLLELAQVYKQLYPNELISFHAIQDVLVKNAIKITTREIRRYYRILKEEGNDLPPIQENKPAKPGKTTRARLRKRGKVIEEFRIIMDFSEFQQQTFLKDKIYLLVLHWRKLHPRQTINIGTVSEALGASYSYVRQLYHELEQEHPELKPNRGLRRTS